MLTGILRGRIRVSGVLQALLLALLLGGCSSSRDHSAGGGVATNDKTVINFWNGFTGPDGRAIEKMVARFQKQNPDITVQMQVIPWGTYYDKLTLSLAYGGAPDAFVMHAGRMPEFATFDKLEALQDHYTTGNPRLKETNFAPVPWQATFYQNQQYALPLDVHWPCPR